MKELTQNLVLSPNHMKMVAVPSRRFNLFYTPHCIRLQRCESRDGGHQMQDTDHELCDPLCKLIFVVNFLLPSAINSVVNRPLSLVIASKVFFIILHFILNGRG